MAIVLSDDDVRRLRLRGQWYDPWQSDTSSPLGPATAVGRVRAKAMVLCGIQAQYMASAALAVRARAVGVVTAADVERARVEERTVIRTWLMRGTLHLIASHNLYWLPLLGPRMIASDQRRRAQLGLDDATCERAVSLIGEALAARGALTRAELADALAPHGIPTAGQAMPHLLYYAAFQAHICFGPDRDGEPTYVLLDQWLNERFGQQVTLNHLALMYLISYGPARPEDFASWSGVPLSSARASWRVLANDLIEVEHEGRPTWIAKARACWLDDLDSRGGHSPQVNLIPAYDPYLLGYQNRELVVAPEYARRVHPGGGVFHNVLLVDGRAMGTWRTTRRRDRLEVMVEPFALLASDVYPGIEAEIADLGHFYAVRAELVVRALE